ncbi:cysteine-rich venom protein-like [Discoglossus pictus]
MMLISVMCLLSLIQYSAGQIGSSFIERSPPNDSSRVTLIDLFSDFRKNVRTTTAAAAAAAGAGVTTTTLITTEATTASSPRRATRPFRMSGVLLSELSTMNATVKQMIVDIHNDLRRNVKPSAKNMLKMEWNEEAATGAACTAKNCYLAPSPQTSRLIQNLVCGESIFMVTTKLSWRTVIESFFKQAEHFEYGKGAKPTGPHQYYTQASWYSSHQLGCAVAECIKPIRYYLYVCNYCPAGNSNSLKPYEAGPACASCPNSCDNGLCSNSCKYQDLRPDCDILKVHCNCGDVQIRKECGSTCYCNNNEIK